MRQVRYWQIKIIQVFGSWVFRIMHWVPELTGGRLLPLLTWSGTENLDHPGNRLIFTPNHKTYVDHFFMGAAFFGHLSILPMSFIGADWLFKLPGIWGWVVRNALWLVGAFPAQAGKGYDVSLAEAERRLNEGYSFCIYPEGGIRYRPGVHEVKKGTAWLARKTGVPIVPVAIRGVEYFTCWGFLFGRRKISVSFGKSYVIPPDADLAQAAARIRAEIDMLYHSLGPSS